MNIQVSKTGRIEEFKNLINSVLQDKKVKTLFILSCDANDFKKDSVDDILKSKTTPIFGGIFPEIIYGNEKLLKGTIVAGLYHKANVQIIPDLSDMDSDYERIIEEKIPDSSTTKTMFVFVDGFAKRISAFIESLFNVFGLEFNYIGGGAGSLSFKQKPCLFTNDGLVQDSAILALMDLESGIGVSHGWKEINGPYQVTESDGNVIKTLDWKPAFQVYKEVVEFHSGKIFKENNFFDIAKGYPFGISKLEAEKIVRDPLMVVDKNAIRCVGEVPEGCYVYVLTGDATSLINAASNTLHLAENDFKAETSNKTILFIDCISRVLFLEDKFNDELKAVYRKNIPLIGALTIGEIANNRKDYLEFYNKTSVIGILED